MPSLQKISIIGSGSWATALVKIFSESGIRVIWNLRSTAHVDHVLEHKSPPHYLSHLSLDLKYIEPIASLETAIGASDHILFALPSAYLEATLAGQEIALPPGKKLLVSIKGVLPETSELPSSYLARYFQVSPCKVMVVGGPCHAEEVALGRRTYLTIAGTENDEVDQIRRAIRSPYLKVVANNDPTGVELAAIMKNVVGIAAGISRGMNFGDNFLAVIVSNALREIEQLLHSLNPIPRDLKDSAYYGDLLVTAYSGFSRNNVFGQLIGRGYSVVMAQSRMQMVAEGYPAAKGLFRLADSAGLKLPVLSAVYRILYRHSSPVNEMRLLEQYLR
ncbi:NAD(P)H-dependent glycerol-3-phosphate dehydrogenase [Flavihumibacter stibioxidans]|uniref:Glycerol-3-phosphate dehydrogenase n=1 Tax=Flavihumibacter stibioxidans TaxID=1834163 RepID=A0ABR7MCL4_9BACT|nr:NAD(P)H-dependent glycerol-3-phosphate dehydrogenase [Flavihumibacter stibioxidans]MBC6492765.1 hypothetical protein [Flavihumibacter stibioxidans]